MVNNLSARKRKNAAHQIKRFITKILTDSVTFKGIGGIPVNYRAKDLKQILGRNYKEYIDMLVADNIVLRNDSYCLGNQLSKGRTKEYYFSPSILDGELISLTIESPYQVLKHRSISVLNDCTIDLRAAQKELEEYVEYDENLLRKASINKEINQEYLSKVLVMSVKAQTIWNKYQYVKNIKKDILLNKFYEPTFSLIKSDKRFFYMPLDQYLINKKRTVLYSYTSSLNKFHGRDYFFREDSNGRIYTNLCNMPRLFIKHIKHKGQPLIEVDLKNAQWVFLAYCAINQLLDNKISQTIRTNNIEIDTPDFNIFLKSAYSGTFYDQIQKALCLSTRDKAKTATFEILFGRNSSKDSESKAAIREVFPTMLKICDLVKLTAGNNYKTLSNELQKVESSIMIENILYNLNKPVLSKHDSFLIPKDHYTQTISMITEKLDKILGIDCYSLQTNSP